MFQIQNATLAPRHLLAVAVVGCERAGHVHLARRRELAQQSSMESARRVLSRFFRVTKFRVAGPPGPGDTAVINSGAGNIVIDASVSIGTVYIGQGNPALAQAGLLSPVAGVPFVVGALYIGGTSSFAK